MLGTTADNEDFVFQVPAPVLFLQDLEGQEVDEVTLIGHTLNEIPENLNLTYRLYDLRRVFVEGATLMNGTLDLFPVVLER